MFRTLRIPAAFLLCLALAAAPAQGCCDDFWSCATAVATSGLSCVVEAAILVAREVILQLNTARAELQKNFDDSVGAMQQQASDDGRKSADDAARAAQETLNALAEARKITGDDLAFLAAKTSPAGAVYKAEATATPTPAPGRGAVSRAAGGALSVFTPTPSPGHGSQVASQLSPEVAQVMSGAHDVLKELEKELEELGLCVKEANRQALEQESVAAAKEAAAAQEAYRGFTDGFLGKLDKLLADLEQAVSDVTKIVSFAPHAVDDLKGILDGFANDVTPLLNRADQSMQGAAGLVQPSASKALSCASQAAAILAKMRRAAQLRTALERQNVQVSIPGQPRTPTPSALGRLRFSPRIAAFFAASKPITAKLDAARLKLRTLPGGPGAAELSTFQKRASANLDSMFNGKAPADRARQRDDLLAEAQSRYASDPKTLQAVRRFITDQARARGVN